jgi:hypothetical protein
VPILTPSPDALSPVAAPADAPSVDPGAVVSSADAPSAVAAAAGSEAPVPLRPLFKSYGKEAQLSPATVKRWSPVVERLIGHLGHDDARAISRADIVAWKDALLDGGMKNVTVRDVYLAATNLAVLEAEAGDQFGRRLGGHHGRGQQQKACGHPADCTPCHRPEKSLTHQTSCCARPLLHRQCGRFKAQAEIQSHGVLGLLSSKLCVTNPSPPNTR